jgi:hypothetical protein
MKAAFDADKIVVGVARFSRFYSDKVDVFEHEGDYSTSVRIFWVSRKGKS